MPFPPPPRNPPLAWQNVRKPAFLFFFLILLGYGVLYAVFSAFNRFGYMPVWSDEYAYFLNGRSVLENLSLGHALILDGWLSKFGGLGHHGVMYEMFDALALGLAGKASWGKLFQTWVLILISAALLLNIRGMPKVRARLALMFVLSHWVAVFYFLTWMQESWNLLFSAILLFYLSRADLSRRSTLAWFAVMILFMSLFRSSWAFAFIIPAFAAGIRRDRFWFSAMLFAAIIFLAFVHESLFQAYYPNFMSGNLMPLVAEGRLIQAFDAVSAHFMHNVSLYLFDHGPFSAYLYNKYLMVVIVLAAVGIGYRQKDAVLMGFGLFGSVFLLVLFSLYDAHSWREQRTLLPLVQMGLPMLFWRVRGNRGLRLSGVGILGLLWILSWTNCPDFMRLHTHRFSSMDSSDTQGEAEMWQSVGAHVDQGDDPVSIILSGMSLGRNPQFLWLPVKTPSGRRVRYAVLLEDSQNGADFVASWILAAGRPPNPAESRNPADWETPFFTLQKLK